MKRTDKRGSALVLVLVASVFLIILTAGAFQYFKNNVDTQVWTRDRIQAKLSAEAGINLATHMLIAGAALPANNNPTAFLGTTSSYFDLPGGMGSVLSYVDPFDSNSVVTNANAFRIRCRAIVPGTTLETFGMESIVMPENLARFAVFMDNPTVNGAYVDGYRFDGPFYANGPVRVYSTSATHDNDPFFYSFKLTSDYYVAIGNTPVYLPTDGGNLQMRPYERLCMGKPYFELGADPIPFGASELDWQGVRTAAISDGLYLTNVEVPSGSRLALNGNWLFIKEDTASIDSFDLGALVNPVVWIDNATTDHFYLRGNQSNGLDMALTIGCIGDVFMSGPLYYENMDLQDPDNTDLLGIMTVYGDLIIADHQLVQPGWGGDQFMVRTDDDFQYSAVLVSLEGDLTAQNPLMPDPGPKEFMILGGYMIQEEGWTSTNTSGFDISVYFDPRLLTMHPPFFPTTANWNVIMWGEVPDMSETDLTNPIPAY